MIRLIYFFRYVLIFTRELTLSTLAVVRLVFSPQGRLKPGFVSLHMEAQTDLEVTALANSITLTPGTISVRVDPERDRLVIHAINIGDNPEAVRQSIKQTLEANILKWTRGPKWNKENPS